MFQVEVPHGCQYDFVARMGKAQLCHSVKKDILRFVYRGYVFPIDEQLFTSCTKDKPIDVEVEQTYNLPCLFSERKYFCEGLKLDNLRNV